MIDQNGESGKPPIALEEGEYRPDFDLLNAYQGFSAELLRLSLLGLGAIGVLMGLIGDREPDFAKHLFECPNRYLFLGSILPSWGPRLVPYGIATSQPTACLRIS